MKLDPPVTQYITGATPSHSSKNGLRKHIKFIEYDEIIKILKNNDYIDENEKITTKALTDGLVDLCENKALWNIKESKKTLLKLTKPQPKSGKPVKAVTPRTSGDRVVWGDLDSIGTYFGVSKIRIGKWIDELGLRALPEIPKNDDGSIDMLDMANQAKQKQADGFISKKPTEKALDNGYAQINVVTGRKDKQFEIVKWNIHKVKELLIKAGHPLDTEKKMLHKGKGKNSDVKVGNINDRVNQIYTKWKKLYNNPTTRQSSWELFKNQPTAIIKRVEALMGAPDFITKRKYLTEEL